MKLDSRILEGKTYLDCYDTEIAKKFIDKECYLSNNVASFANVDSLYKAVLKEVDEEAINPYTLENTRWRHSSNFILPCEWVKQEPKYRPFKDHTEYKEYLNDGIIESWIQIREKNSKEIWDLMYTGGRGIFVSLGAYIFNLKDLFDDFELKNEQTGEWQPFGVIEDD